MIGRRGFLRLTLLLAARLRWGDDRQLKKLRDELEGLIARSGTEAVGVAFLDPASGDELLLKADEPFHAASTMKIAVLLEVFRQAKAGLFKIDDPIVIKNQFTSIVDGSAFELDSKDDSEPTLYTKIGQKVTIAELSRLMIVRSSNLATNVLLTLVTPEKTTEFMKVLDAPGVKVLRCLEDAKAYALGRNNTVTARGLATLLRLIADRKAVSPEASDAMLAILKAQEFREGIPARLPLGTVVAHKTGSITKHYHDAAIIFPKGRGGSILVVLTRGLADEKQAHSLVAEIAAKVYDQVCRR